ncbi:MAG: sugar phosphate nucleotidyltransferase, partial [Elusimicrobiota bacterium]
MDPGRVLTVLLAGGRGQRLDPLTRDRAKPAVPFGAAYRIIDFTLSNCVNSGLTKVLTLVQYRSRSLNEHIRTAWSRFFNNTRGEFIEALPPQHHLNDSWYGGTANAVYQNMFALKDEHPDLIVVLSGDHIYKMDYRDLLRAHTESGAEATVCAVEVPKNEASAFGVLHVDEKNAIQAFVEKVKDPPEIPGKPGLCLASMGVYVFNFKMLEKALEEDTDDSKSSHDFGRDIIPKCLGKKKLFAFPFIDKNTKKNQYWRDVGT